MKTFSLSANIENGFAENSNYIVTPNAQQAVYNIVNDFQIGKLKEQEVEALLQTLLHQTIRLCILITITLLQLMDKIDL